MQNKQNKQIDLIEELGNDFVWVSIKIFCKLINKKRSFLYKHKKELNLCFKKQNGKSYIRVEKAYIISRVNHPATKDG